MKTPVKYLNIIRMSEYRQDAHTSIYTSRKLKLLTNEQQNQPDGYANCRHCCLPGQSLITIIPSLGNSDIDNYKTTQNSSCLVAQEKNSTLQLNTTKETEDYGFSLDFSWSPFLIKMYETRNRSKVLKLDELSEPKRWKGADVMVFNTGHWWTHTGRFKRWDYYQDGEKIVQEMEGHSAFETALSTWARWIDHTVSPTKTSVFFRSISPEHKRSNLHQCYNQTQPITNDNEAYRKTFPAAMVNIVEQTIKKMRVPVNYLNVTRLSEYRRDAHTSVYTVRQGKLLNEEQRKQPQLFADCSHWCLPGLPDTWNALIHALLVEPPLFSP
ncbi:uncharacterized protein A4U43_C01F3580 [Asparagus officinalis]|uniref:Trichome birefringence-like C-terminal domain-containing protein n=1 Tax=Asparagus officinalis TaxID=4686 RepID=A0A5P1FM50_ASPOF|nr:uncharacterized protein A4U43_C01F3580 [Asparagus officinalis]